MLILLLTFSKVNNYGANLQCYALSEVLKQMGHSVQIIDFQVSQKKSKNPIYNIFSAVQRRKFESFRSQYLPAFTPKINKGEDIYNKLPKADCYIVGSDQVWNPNLTKGVGVMTYFFDFLPKNVKRISYAASFGIDNIEPFDAYPQVSELLNRFNSISVREFTGVDICKTLCGITPDLVIDPTMLLGDYSNFITKLETDNLYTFFFRHQKQHYDIARNIARSTGSKPHILSHYKYVKGFSNIYSCHVVDWVNRLANAKFVVTDSFHCTVFSILHHRNFIVFKMPGKSGRVATLLKSLGLESRLCDGIDDFEARKTELLTQIEYTDIDGRIAEMRISSLNFLNEALK